MQLVGELRSAAGTQSSREVVHGLASTLDALHAPVRALARQAEQTTGEWRPGVIREVVAELAAPVRGGEGWRFGREGDSAPGRHLSY